ncbi:MAG: class I SAM-dependent rRNA methyltransferase [Ignavibacteriaceae bacterium]
MKPKIFLRKNEERRINAGHLWIFSNEIEKLEGTADNGDLVEIFDARNNFIGTGFYNKNSLIAVRLLDKSQIDNFREFVEIKIKDAFALRKLFYPDRNSFRLIFSESDLMPGLIIDKYNDTFVLQIYSAGMQKNIAAVISVLQNEFNAKNIFTKNETYFRTLEGLPEADEIFLGESTSEIIDDGSVKFRIDFQKSHKTGFYFDQCDNRLFIEKFVKGKTVLDAFCNSGGFGLHSAKAGASSVTFVDSSASEIENSKFNFELNNLVNQAEFVVSDVFDYLGKLLPESKKFDVVMIDPPAFAKSKKTLSTAKKGYEKLNRMALQLVSKNGILVTSSCSHHLEKEEFIQIVNSAAVKLQKRIQLINYNGASIDHPVIPAMPETVYLKFAVFRVL